jgi:hypothetical protein
MHMDRDIDKLIREIQRLYPGVAVEQLPVKHPGVDDDGLWFFRHPDRSIEVQVESSTGALPFLIEVDHHPPRKTQSVGEAVSVVAAGLGLGGATV